MTETDPKARDGQAIKKQVVGTAGEVPARCRSTCASTRRQAPSKPVPVILLGELRRRQRAAAAGRSARAAPAPPLGEPPVADEILARGWGYATHRYQDIQPDRANR